ncbi:MAG: hypothetical protein WKF36_09430 [Candidatus Nitrosocosmicus sp.]
MKTVVVKHYLSHLPEVDDNNGIRNSFKCAFLYKIKEQGTRRKRKTNLDLLKIDYVRLNITGRK